MADDRVRVTVEMGADYQPSERVQAALRDLDLALQDAHGDEVSGFAFDEMNPLTFTYQKIEWTWMAGSPLGRKFDTIVSPRDPQSGLPTG